MDGTDADTSSDAGSDAGSSGLADSSSGDNPSTTADPSTSGDPGAPIWTTVPTLSFVQGVPSELSVTEYVSDPDGDALTLMLNGVELPEGVTFDAAGMKFVYDGSGPIATSSGHVLTADDGMA